MGGGGRRFFLVAEEKEFLIVHKRPGIGFHSDADEPGLLSLVREQSGCPALYPVHRLDRITSGLVVMAKTQAANRELSQRFQSRQVEKYYLALSNRVPKRKQGLVKGDMARGRRGGWKLVPSVNNPAVTQFFSRGSGSGLRLFVLKPHTGKTHQLRVALKSLGAPVLGDLVYGSEEADRGYLHAFALGFELNHHRYRYLEFPRDGQYFADPAMASLMDEYREPWALPWPSLKQVSRG